ncbi:MAG TPA: PAS domain-containing protein, partial [Deinococcales bacterium]|nr:PAS domain-containing protein [Deinococcales bacterium]
MASFNPGLDALPVIVLVADEHGQVVTVNDRWSRLTGLSASSSLGDGWLGAFHPDDRAALADRWREARAAGGSWRVEARLKMLDGEARWVEGRLEPHYRAGRLAGLTCVFVDVDARRRLEANLRDAEGAWRQVINSIAQLAWMAEPDGSIFWYNSRWFEYTGTTPEQMLGWGWQSVHDPRELPRVLAEWREVIAEGRPLEMTFPLRGADGAYRPFLTRAIPVKDEAGQVLRWFGTNTEVTGLQQLQEERERLLATLSVERRRLSDALRHAPALVALVRASDGAILLANPGIERFFDRSLAGQTVEKAFKDLLHLEVFERLERVRRTGVAENAREVLTRLPRRSGTLDRFLNVSLQPIEAAGG